MYGDLDEFDLGIFDLTFLFFISELGSNKQKFDNPQQGMII